MITDDKVGDWLERASKRTATTGMVADGIRIVERLIKENGELRVALTESVTANAVYEESIEQLRANYRDEKARNRFANASSMEKQSWNLGAYRKACERQEQHEQNMHEHKD